MEQPLSISTHNSPRIGCVIPAFNGGSKTVEIIKRLKPIVEYIVVVDDACPAKTGHQISTRLETNVVKVLYNPANKGVGYSSKRGMRELMHMGAEIIVKIDADGQISPELIPSLIEPIISGKSEAAKGNRFTKIDHILSMPKIRIIGNLGLSFLNKLSTGYWELFDPTNGFVAFKVSALQRVRVDKTDDRYFFESDLLYQCALARITFSQLPMRSIYRDEISSLRPMKEISRFAGKHLINFLKRLVYQYFVLDFNAGSLELMGGVLGLFLAILFSLKILVSGILYNKYATPGEASIFAILSIITIQMFIAFVYYDATLQPLLRRLQSKT